MLLQEKIWLLLFFFFTKVRLDQKWRIASISGLELLSLLCSLDRVKNCFYSPCLHSPLCSHFPIDAALQVYQYSMTFFHGEWSVRWAPHPRFFVHRFSPLQLQHAMSLLQSWVILHQFPLCPKCKNQVPLRHIFSLWNRLPHEVSLKNTNFNLSKSMINHYLFSLFS